MPRDLELPARVSALTDNDEFVSTDPADVSQSASFGSSFRTTFSVLATYLDTFYAKLALSPTQDQKEAMDAANAPATANAFATLADIVSGSGHVIQDSGTPVPNQPNLNFTGSGVAVTDNVGNSATDVTVTDTTYAANQVVDHSTISYVGDGVYITGGGDATVGGVLTVGSGTVTTDLEEAVGIRAGNLVIMTDAQYAGLGATQSDTVYITTG